MPGWAGWTDRRWVSRTYERKIDAGPIFRDRGKWVARLSMLRNAAGPMRIIEIQT